MHLLYFRFVPQRGPFRGTIGGVGATILAYNFLHVLETLAEFGVGATQCLLCINVQPACGFGNDEEQVAEFFQLMLRRDSLLYFTQFLLHLLPHVMRIDKLEADFGGTLLVLLRNSQRGRGKRHTIEDALLLNILSGGNTFLLLDSLPVPHY